MNYVIVQDFGYINNPPAELPPCSIVDLAEYTFRRYGNCEDTLILAQEHCFRQLRKLFAQSDENMSAKLQEIRGGQSTSVDLHEGTSFQVLEAAKIMILDEECQQTGGYPKKIIADLVAHRHHAPRMIRQGRVLNMELVTRYGLPDKYYKVAAQWWCRNKFFWYFRELVGYLPLKLAGQI